MEIKKDIRNELMQRREIQLVLEAEKTPSFADASKMIAEKTGASEDAIMVENVKGKFGSRIFDITAGIYDSKELKEAALKRLTKPKKTAGEAAPEEAAKK